ncbi:MAG TPA: hypothetical protein VGO00_10270 [Kofleriaceae bacterium]|nr:hypothetical protein [Kofleriaceae bacterium]
MFRWKRAVLHALIPFGLVVLVGLVALFVTDPVDPEKAGEGVGRFAAVAFVIGIAISYLWQTGKKLAAKLTALALLLFVAAIGIGLVTNDTHRRHHLVVDRSPLVEVTIDGQVRLRHPTYGFSFLRPPKGYAAADALIDKFGITPDPEGLIYAFAETPPTAVVMVHVLTDVGESRAEFAAVALGIRAGLTGAAGKDLKIQTLRDEMTGTNGHLVQHFHLVIDGMHMQITAYQLKMRGTPSVAAVMVVGGDNKALADVLDSFRP